MGHAGASAVRQACDEPTWLRVLVLGVSGLLLVLGGVLHPQLSDDGQQREAIGSSAWLASHWLLTLGQPLGIVGVFLLARRPDLPDLGPGALLAGVGLLLGTLGTLSAATLLRAAAAGTSELHHAADAWTLGLGWLALLVGAAGAMWMGLRLAWSGPWRPFGALLAAAMLVALVAAVLLGPAHPWTHDGLLRYSAVLLGVLLVGLGILDGRSGQAAPGRGAHEGR